MKKRKKGKGMSKSKGKGKGKGKAGRKAAPKAKAAPVRKAASPAPRPPRPPAPPSVPPGEIIKRLEALERMMRRIMEILAKLASAGSRAHVVDLDEEGHPSHNPVLDKSEADRVCWRNRGATDRTLVFAAWPFTTAKADIAVPAGTTSAAYTPVYDHADGTGYAYTIEPKPGTTGGPPGGPEVITDD